MVAKILATILLAIVLLGGFFALGYFLDHRSYVYEGIEVFETEQELNEFKIAIVNDDFFTVRRLDFVRDAYPEIVDFEILTADRGFPYGELHYDKFGRIFFPFLGMGVFLFISLAVIWK